MTLHEAAALLLSVMARLKDEECNADYQVIILREPGSYVGDTKIGEQEVAMFTRHPDSDETKGDGDGGVD